MDTNFEEEIERPKEEATGSDFEEEVGHKKAEVSNLQAFGLEVSVFLKGVIRSAIWCIAYTIVFLLLYYFFAIVFGLEVDVKTALRKIYLFLLGAMVLWDVQRTFWLFSIRSSFSVSFRDAREAIDLFHLEKVKPISQWDKEWLENQLATKRAIGEIAAAIMEAWKK